MDSLGDTSHAKRSRHKNLTSFFVYSKNIDILNKIFIINKKIIQNITIMNTKFLEKITDPDFLSRLVLYLSVIGIFYAVVSFVFLEQILLLLILEALLIVLGVLGIGYFLRCKKLKKEYLKEKTAMAKESIKLYTDLQNNFLQIAELLPSSLKDSDSWIVKQIESCQQKISQAKKELKDLEGEWSFYISSSSLLSGYFLALYVRSIQIFYIKSFSKAHFLFKEFSC